MSKRMQLNKIEKLILSLISVIVLAVIAIAVITKARAINEQNAIWEARFFSVMPLNSSTSPAYCLSHSPNTYDATVQKMSKEGALSQNGITVKYDTYLPTDKNNLHFAEATGTFSGTEDGKAWEEKIYVREQSLDLLGSTYGIWSSEKCKGFFISQVKGK